MTQTEIAQALTEAYHLAFDVKDDIGDKPKFGGPEWEARNAAFDAIQALDRAMRSLGIEPPARFDGDGRPA